MGLGDWLGEHQAKGWLNDTSTGELSDVFQKECWTDSISAPAKNSIPVELDADNLEYIAFTDEQQPRLCDLPNISLTAAQIKEFSPELADIFREKKIDSISLIAQPDGSKKLILVAQDPFEFPINRDGCKSIAFDKTVLAHIQEKKDGSTTLSLKGVKAVIDTDITVLGTKTPNIDTIALKPQSCDIEVSASYYGIPVPKRTITVDGNFPEMHAQFLRDLVRLSTVENSVVPAKIQDLVEQKERESSPIQNALAATIALFGVEFARRWLRSIFREIESTPESASAKTPEKDRASKLPSEDRRDELREERIALENERADLRKQINENSGSTRDFKLTVALMSDLQANSRKLECNRHEMIYSLRKIIQPLAAELQAHLPAIEREIGKAYYTLVKQTTDHVAQEGLLRDQQREATEQGDQVTAQRLERELTELAKRQQDMAATHVKDKNELLELRTAAKRTLEPWRSDYQVDSFDVMEALENHSKDSTKPRLLNNEIVVSDKPVNRQRITELIRDARRLDIALHDQHELMPRTYDKSTPYILRTKHDVPVEINGSVPQKLAMKILEHVGDSLIFPAHLELVCDRTLWYKGVARENGTDTIKINLASGESSLLTYDHESGHLFSHAVIKSDPKLSEKINTVYQNDLKNSDLTNGKITDLLRQNTFVDPRSSAGSNQGRGLSAGELRTAYGYCREEITAECFKLFIQEKQHEKHGKKLTFAELIAHHIDDTDRARALRNFKGTYEALREGAFEAAYARETANPATPTKTTTDVQRTTHGVAREIEGRPSVSVGELDKSRSSEFSEPGQRFVERRASQLDNQRADLGGQRTQLQQERIELRSRVKGTSQPIAQAILKNVEAQIDALDREIVSNLKQRLEIESQSRKSIEMDIAKQPESAHLKQKLAAAQTRERALTVAFYLERGLMPPTLATRNKGDAINWPYSIRNTDKNGRSGMGTVPLIVEGLPMSDTPSTAAVAEILNQMRLNRNLPSQLRISQAANTNYEGGSHRSTTQEVTIEISQRLQLERGKMVDAGGTAAAHNYNHEIGHNLQMIYFDGQPPNVRKQVMDLYIKTLAASPLGSTLKNYPEFQEVLASGQYTRAPLLYHSCFPELFAEMHALHRLRSQINGPCTYQELLQLRTAKFQPERSAVMKDFEPLYEALVENVFKPFDVAGETERLSRATSAARTGGTSEESRNPADKLASNQSGPPVDEMERALDVVEPLSKALKVKEMVEYIETLKNSTTIRALLDVYLSEIDPRNIHLETLAKSKSIAGIVALDKVLSTNVDRLRPTLEERIKDGSITQAILAGDVAPTILRHSTASGTELLKQLVNGLNGDSLSTATKLYKIIALDNGIGGDKPFEQLQEAALKEISNLPPAQAKQELFKMARLGNERAAQALEKLWQNDPAYDLEHKSRTSIPDEAIRKFHQAVNRIGQEHGLTDAEVDHYKKVAADLKLVKNELLKYLEKSEAGSDGAELRTDVIMNEPINIELARKVLFDRPKLLTQYELMAREFPAFNQTKEKIDKIAERLMPEISRMAGAGGLPPLTSLTPGSKNSFGSYGGLGATYFDELYAKRSALTSADFVNTIVHELGHYEQDVATVRYLLEEHGVKKGTPITITQFRAISARYKQLHYIDLQPSFLRKVMGVLNGEPLNDAERLRAQRLIVSSALNEVVEPRIEALHKRMNLVAGFAARVNDANDIESLKRVWETRGLTKTRDTLAKLCDSHEQTKALKAFDKLKELSEGNVEFNSPQFKDARDHFTETCTKISLDLRDSADDLYKNKFHELDTFAAGKHAEAVVNSMTNNSQQPNAFEKPSTHQSSSPSTAENNFFDQVIKKLSPAAKQWLQSQKGHNQDIEIILTEILEDSSMDQSTKDALKLSVDAYKQNDAKAVTKLHEMLAAQIVATSNVDKGPTTITTPPSTGAPPLTKANRETSPNFTPEFQKPNPPAQPVIEIVKGPGGFARTLVADVSMLTVEKAKDFFENDLAKRIKLLQVDLDNSTDKTSRDELVNEMKVLQAEYLEYTQSPDKDSYCKDFIARSKAAAKESAKTSGLGVSAKAGTLAGVLIVAGYILIKPNSTSNQQYHPVTPTKQASKP